ncbi:diacylglycerol kinase family protein [Paenibacillus sp. FSL K6-0276]|uniref:diacylglycerol/lipid kinase family protein n=1 Tax=Paenibacillus sp. FSL K6-0276 TaxID=2921450 RepID=UPI0030ECBC9C
MRQAMIIINPSSGKEEAGGDGTLHETINGLMNQKQHPKLGVVPLGTVNDFARALQIPLNPEIAIQTLASSNVKTVDIGCLNDRLFGNVVAVGSIAGSLSSVSTEEKTKFIMTRRHARRIPTLPRRVNQLSRWIRESDT